ncbi:hypothetical protein SAVERM_483 [Streptomyces avermitilis MA-4680 = NBRC 14893]|uniref:Uncharacterized protein n=1 Tax=Streptomyces avermitilis (strain ATCC 31267 / DSM 46492 / JCM 5070 / NBRC 14893 / NCIMB 12804 / NRRL 8165 / MA-4680) TaxID=227882 RepID=Q82QM2_STRAW|nr:hypothetical protein SAVERM_483 [Streptomyces avermitilis MA-4680 = NBRC 14893]
MVSKRRSAAPGRGSRAAVLGMVLPASDVGDHEELVAAEVHHHPGVRALGVLVGGVLFRTPPRGPPAGNRSRTV